MEYAQGEISLAGSLAAARVLSKPSSSHGKLPVLTSLLSWPEVPWWLLSLAAGLGHVAVDEAPLASGAGDSCLRAQA